MIRDDPEPDSEPEAVRCTQIDAVKDILRDQPIHASRYPLLHRSLHDDEVLRSTIKLRPHTHEDMRGIEKNEHVGEGWRALQDVSKVKLKAPRLFAV